MKKWVIILSLFLTLPLLAIDREIVVLTSIHTPNQRPFWRSKAYKISKDIEQQFQHYFKDSGYPLHIQHQATMQTLHHALLSPKSLAVFWVSHSAAERTAHGLQFSSTIQDYYGNNVKLLFQNINPNMQFLGIIGCQAKKIITQFRRQNLYPQTLKIYSASKKIRLNDGIKAAIKSAATILDQNPHSFDRQTDMLTSNCQDQFGYDRSCYRDTIQGKYELLNLDYPRPFPKKSGFTIHIINPNRTAAILKIKNYFIGLLQPINTRQTFTIPYNLLTKGRIKLEVIYDKQNTQKYFAPLHIGSYDFSNIRPLKDKRGRMYGLHHNFYYLK